MVWGCVLSDDGTYVVSVEITEKTFTNTYVYYDEKVNNEFTGPRRAGYTFMGWATEDGGTVAYSAAEISQAPIGTVLYAVWEEGEEPEPVEEEEEEEEQSGGESAIQIIPAE